MTAWDESDRAEAQKRIHHLELEVRMHRAECERLSRQVVEAASCREALMKAGDKLARTLDALRDTRAADEWRELKARLAKC